MTAPKVLIVEDNQHIRLMTKNFLKKDGYEVIEAQNGVEGAAKFIEDEEIKAVFLDIMMPGGDGFKFLELTEKERTERETPICVLSALEDQNKIISILESGASDYLIKPVDKEILLDKASCLIKKENRSFAQIITEFDVTFEDIEIPFKAISVSESSMTLEVPEKMELPKSSKVIEGKIIELMKSPTPIIGRFSELLSVGGKYMTRFYFIGVKEVYRKNLRSWTVRGGELNEEA